MDIAKVSEKIKAVTKNGKISCKQAMKVAEEEGVSTREIGNLLNELKIKVMGCQLGCFP